ncbi:hypothetical protein MHYP_G00048760 [Metynnis hypsauchen]
MSKLECNKQKASPKYQHPSTDRIMLNGITTTPSNRSARARDITSMLVGVCSCLKCAMEMMTTEFPRMVTDIANTSSIRQACKSWTKVKVEKPLEHNPQYQTLHWCYRHTS